SQDAPAAASLACGFILLICHDGVFRLCGRQAWDNVTRNGIAYLPAIAAVIGITGSELADRSKRWRPRTIVRSQVTVPPGRRLLHTQRSCRARERGSMSPEQASVIIPISVAFVIYASMHVNIFMVKRKIREWKKWSTLVFVWSTGMGGVK